MIWYSIRTYLYANGYKIPKCDRHGCSSQLGQDRDHVRQHICDHNGTSREDQRVLSVEMDSDT